MNKPGADNFDKHAPTTSVSSTTLLTGLAGEINIKANFVDISQAFLQDLPEDHVCMKLALGVVA